jgi:multidrug efflux pump subunit AcrB
MIPISFIGVFFAFYLTEASFDQGGFASLIMLSGLVVNAGIYIINQNNINIRSVNLERRNPLKLLVKSYNYKLLPVSLTIIATILGMIPFFIDGKSEVFWYSFALGTTSGLLFSFLTIIFFLPIFVKK